MAKHDAPSPRLWRPSANILLPTLIALIFLVATFVQADLKLLWGDEFVTYWIGHQYSFVGIWRALQSGADPNPPLMHILDWWSTSLFGDNPIAIRLPSILAMGLAMGCLRLFLERRIAPVYAAIGCLALMTTRGFDYAYDARSYSLLMGFAMAAILLWSRSVHACGWRRILLLTGVAIALAAGVSSNYYGVLMFISIAIGELRFSAAHKRSRPGAWIAMAAASLPLLAYVKLVRLNLTEFGPHAWNKPHLLMIVECYVVIVEGLLWLVIGLAIYSLLRFRTDSDIEVRDRPFPSWERGPVGVLLLYPVGAFAMAFGSSAMVSPRCAIAVCLGFAIWAAALLSRCVNRRTAIGVVAFLCVWILARQAACGYVLLHQRHAFLLFTDAVERAAAPAEPVVVGDSLLAMPLYWYGSTALRQQIVFPIDFDAIHRTEPDDSGEQNLWGGRNGVFPVPIAAPDDLLKEHQERVLVAPPQGWLARDLRLRGYELIDQPARVPWDRLGGVFTPMAHEQTRIMIAVPK